MKNPNNARRTLKDKIGKMATMQANENKKEWDILCIESYQYACASNTANRPKKAGYNSTILGII